jgi:flagellar FliJ protein
MYRFKLEALLNHRRHQEEVCQKELADAQRELTAVQKKLSRLKKEKRANIQNLQTRQQESKTVSNILLFINFIEQLCAKIETQIRRLQKATQMVNQKRDDLISIMKKRKILEKLKEKEWLAYQQKILHEERKFNDEVAATRHVRKM